jgi:hypothetical protein
MKPQQLKSYFTENDMTYQLVPPYWHRRNAAERAIRTFKEYFVAVLSSVDPDFPMHRWGRILPQAEIILNLLCTSRLHPQLSAEAHFCGLIDYNKTAFASPGCNIISHEKPSQRRTWAPRNLSPINLSQRDFWNMGSSNNAIALGNNH